MFVMRQYVVAVAPKGNGSREETIFQCMCITAVWHVA